MSSFNEFEGIPASMNRYLMQDLLRDSWGFKGFIVSDATAIAEEVNHGIGDLQEVSAAASWKPNTNWDTLKTRSAI